MKRHKLLTCAALILSSLAFALTMSAPAHTAAAPAPAQIAAVPLHHFYELQKDYFHFYTADPDEVAALKKHKGWKYVGITGYVFPKQTSETVPLYRLVKSEFGGTNHFYTINMNEANKAVNGGWKAEGIAGYVAPKQLPGTAPLYRLYLDPHGDYGKGSGGDVHYYTASGVEKNTAIYNGMRLIRIEAYLWKKP